jgi:hypothetical protein
MTEHRRYADLAAMAIDFTLDATDAEDLRRHLESCTPCRRLSDAMRSDAAAMRSIDFGPAPVIVRDRVAAFALKGGAADSPRLLLWFAAGLLLLLAVFAGSAAVGAILQQQRSDLTSVSPIHWTTEVAELAAADLWVEAAGQRFSPVGMPVSLVSDPGGPDFLTLEAGWQERGQEMRLNLYFGADQTSWWVNAIQAYDGREKPDWAAIKGTFFRSPLGRAWTGNVDLPLQAGAPGVQVHIRGLHLIARPHAGFVQPKGGAPNPVPVPAPNGGAPKPSTNLFARGGPLHCSGIFQMAPDEAHQALLKSGYAVTWRYVKDGFSDARDTPPEGVIVDSLTGTSGEVIMFVVPPADVASAPGERTDFSDCQGPGPTRSPVS